MKMTPPISALRGEALFRRTVSWFRLSACLLFAFMVAANAAEVRHLYVFRAPKDRDGFRTLKPSIEVHDINNGHKLLKVIPVTVPSGTRPVGDIRGVMAHAGTQRIYISHYGATATDSRHSPGWVLCIDMMTNKPLWHKYYDKSVDRGALSPDGKTIYMPNGETTGLIYWHVIDAATGALKGKVEHISQSHNTICSADGRVFLQGFGKPDSTKYSSTVGHRAPEQRMLKVFDPSNGTSKLVGPFRETCRPFTINGKGSLVFMTVNDFIGFQVGDVGTGKVLFTANPPSSGDGYNYNGNKGSYTFAPAKDVGATKSHGIAMTANEKFIYHVDNSKAGVHVYDVSGLPTSAPKWVVFLKGHSGSEKDSSGNYLYGETGIYGQPAWISSSYDGRYFYPETGEIIDTTTHRYVGQLKGGNGKYTHSRFMLEIVFNNGTPVRAGDQFGVGRVTGTTTSLTAPAAPSSLMASAKSSSQIDLAWVDNSTNESGFVIEQSADGSSYAQIATVGSNVKTYSSLSLVASKTYYFRVRAFNSAGNSAASNIASATTLASQSKPSAPTSLVLTVKSSSQIDLSWKDNSTVESGFRIERSTDGINFTQIAQNGANAVTYSSTGLTASTKYYFRVKAYNTAGDSSYSNVASATTLAAPVKPTAPTNPSATAVSASQINLAWTDASNNEDGFWVRRSTDGTTFSAVATLASGATTYADTGLTASTKYYYRITAYNAAGSESSYTVNATTAAIPVAPSAPTNPSAAAVSVSQINLAWTDASNNEDGFWVRRSTDGTTFSVVATVAAGATSYSDTGLGATTKYYYRITAFNAVGSASSPTVSATTLTPLVKPAAPTGATATAVSASQINLAWADASNNEDGFWVRRSADGTTFSVVATVAAGATSYSDTGLAEKTQYHYRITAFNAAGSQSSSTVSATTPAIPVAPNAPTGASATVVSLNQIDLKWQDASDNENGFWVRRSTDGKTFTVIAQMEAGATAYSDKSVASSTQYFYRITAYNDVGYQSSSTVTATTPAPAPPIALLVVGSLPLTTADGAVASRLEGLGYDVRAEVAAVVNMDHADGAKVILISSSVSSPDLGVRFRNAAIPVICWEPYLLDDMGMTGTAVGTDYAWSRNQTTIQVSGVSGVLGTGISGNQQVYLSAADMAIGKPSAAAQIIATVGTSNSACLFTYRSGAAMASITAPAARVAFFMGDNGPLNLTPAGWQLFEQAVAWAAAN